jgi:hypothetical protein
MSIIHKPIDLQKLDTLLIYTPLPATSDELTMASKRLYAPKNVTEFFESMPSGKVFKDKSEVIQLSEEFNLLMEEEAMQEELNEKLRSYD